MTVHVTRKVPGFTGGNSGAFGTNNIERSISMKKRTSASNKLGLQVVKNGLGSSEMLWLRGSTVRFAEQFWPTKALTSKATVP
jgi:hypothetical protein